MPVGRGLPKHESEVLYAVLSELEERLEPEVLEEVVPTDVDDEGKVRLELRNVGEVLIRSNAHVYATTHAPLSHCSHHVEVGCFIRDQVVGIEVSARLGKLVDQPNESRIDDGRRADANVPLGNLTATRDSGWRGREDQKDEEQSSHV